MQPAWSSTGLSDTRRKRGHRAITLFLGPKLETYMNIKIQKLLPISAAAMLFASMATGAVADEVVKIGHVAPLTGGIAHLGKDNENGARLAVEEINAKGLTIGGQKVTLQLDAQDDAADPRTATQVAQKLVDDKVVAVVGHLNSGTTIPASKIYSDAGIVQISPSATNPTYTQQGFKTTYRVVATDAQQGPALANYAAKGMKVKSVAIVDDSTAYGQGLANEFEKTAKALGLKVLSHDATNDKAVDFRAILTKIKGENPDAAMAVERMNGGAEFSAKYTKRFGHPIEFDAPFTYDAVYIVVDAMKRANSV